MLEYVKSFLVLFIMLTLLLYLIPGEHLRKYIKFFSELVLTIGVLSPLLSVFVDSDHFLNLIEYETFAENLSETARDMERMEYMQSDYYLQEYEKAIEVDVSQLIQEMVSTYGYRVKGVGVDLTKDYQVEEVEVWLDSDMGEIELQACQKEIREKIATYYQVEEERIAVEYGTADQ